MTMGITRIRPYIAMGITRIRPYMAMGITRIRASMRWSCDIQNYAKDKDVDM
jgi:hypothetical protein